MQPKPRRRHKLSAIVVSYNREEMIGTVLRGLQFADEVILLDKSSTDRTVEIGGVFADRVVRAPWSPTVEETRVSMESYCTHDWVLFLDDDECLSPEAALFIDKELYEPRADLYRLPRRDYIMAQHDEDAYYWPELHIRLFRKGALRFVPTVHGGIEELSERSYDIPSDAGIAIHHLSHADVHQWIDKTNRYTSRPERVRVLDEGADLAHFAHRSIDRWLKASRNATPGSYSEAVAILRSTYDLIDRLKSWEEARGVDGRARFAELCQALDLAYETHLTPIRRPRVAGAIAPSAPLQALAATEAADPMLVRANASLVAMLRQMQEAEEALRKAHEQLQAEAEQQRAEVARLRAEAEQQRANHVMLQLFAMDLTAQLKQISLSTSWRLTGPLRLLGRQVPFLARNGRRSLRLAFWMVTGQLWRRLEERRKRLASEATQPDPEQNVALPQLAGQSPPQADTIHLPVAETPRVTIIIPTYGGVDYPLRCLASIAAAPPATPFEVLVADDATPGEDVLALERVSGLRFIRWPENMGFLRSCNAAAKLAKGDFLFFLNNDTELLPGAVDTLVDLFDARPDAGMIGSKLIYPDGRLQEAGGIMWRDASAWNYGNRSDPQRPEFNYVREVDYISGAAIMLPRALWEKIGGFDEHFLPAYCEDSDLAFRLRAAGWKVLYQPRSVVIHHEGITHGTNTSQGVKAHQVINTQRLRERWRETLEREHLPNGERVLRARDRSLARRLTLVVDHYVPEPDRDAGSRTMLAFMDALLATGRLVKFLPSNLNRSPGYAEALEARGIEVICRPWYESAEAWLRQYGAEVDEILLSRPSVANELLAPLRRHCRAPIAFYGHDLHFARMASEPGAQKNPAKNAAIAKMEVLERRIWRMVDIVLYPSEDEVKRVWQLAPGKRARSVPAYALPPVPPAPKSAPDIPNLLFVGSFRHPPNVDAAIWLVREIWPLIRRNHAAAQLTIIGSSPPLDVLALALPGVEVRGHVTDQELAQAYRKARVALCPLRSGAGVKLKVVEAMHNAVPVVTTGIGIQGLPGIDTLVDIAEDASGLALAACQLLADDRLWQQRAKAQQNYVSAHFSPEAMREALVEAFDAIVGQAEGLKIHVKSNYQPYKIT
jgi:GT2 family glycosyltransferase